MKFALGSDPIAIENGTGGNIEAAVRVLLAENVRGCMALHKRIEDTTAHAKDAGEFTFGTQQEFVDGLQGRIGLPDGFNVEEWERSVENEHCSVDKHLWGGSHRKWVTGNYMLSTSPRNEFRYDT